MDFLAGLNPQQREAAAHVDGPLLILAGAGSGKTRVITHRIANLIHAHRVYPAAILAVTFTNKAAEEMRLRVMSLLAKAGIHNGPALSTFHSFCVRLLRRDGERLADVRPGFTRSFTIYDDDDQVSILRGMYKDLGLDEKSLPYRSALSRISGAKSQKQSPDEMSAKATDPISKRIAVLYDRYEGALRQANALDFDDLLLEAVRLLRHDGQTRELYNERLRFLMIDEYQDTNRSQYELMRLLSHGGDNVAVVGDEDQSIYSWRGADIRNILDFERDFPSAKVIRLEQNYRSTKNILDVAGAVIANNKDRKGKWLWTESGEGSPIGLYNAQDGEREALWVADTIEKVMAENPQERVAILYRTNFQSRQMEEALRRYGRKYAIVGGLSFYQRAEIKDTMAYLKAIQSPQDSISLLRIINTPARGIGKSTLDQIQAVANERKVTSWTAIEQLLEEDAFPGRAATALAAFRKLIEDLRKSLVVDALPAFLKNLLERSGYITMLEQDRSADAQGRLENLNELINASAEAAERGEGLTEFLDHAALASDSDKIDSAAQVSMLTIHNAKGLEFPVVFIIGLEEGLFPHSRSIQEGGAAQMEEERRLCYVAMTRAEKRLYLCHARYRRRYGGGNPEVCIPSRFLKEAPSHLVESLSPEDNEFSQVDLYSERHDVRQTVRKNLYTGKTYNSIENIAQFFAEKGMPAPRGIEQTSNRLPAPSAPVSPAPKAVQPGVTPPAKPAPVAAPQASVPSRTLAPKKKSFGVGSTIDHPKYGRGTVLRREGDGDDAKLTVSFPRVGLKKLVEKYAGIKRDE